MKPLPWAAEAASCCVPARPLRGVSQWRPSWAGSSSSSGRDTRLTGLGPHPVTSCHLSHLPKGPTHLHIQPHWGLGPQHVDLGGHSHSVHSKWGQELFPPWLVESKSQTSAGLSEGPAAPRRTLAGSLFQKDPGPRGAETEDITTPCWVGRYVPASSFQKRAQSSVRTTDLSPPSRRGGRHVTRGHAVLVHLQGTSHVPGRARGKQP